MNYKHTNREAVIVCAQHVVERPSKPSAVVLIIRNLIFIPHLQGCQPLETKKREIFPFWREF